MDPMPPDSTEQTEAYLRLLNQHDRWLATYVYSLVSRPADADLAVPGGPKDGDRVVDQGLEGVRAFARIGQVPDAQGIGNGVRGK